jgi:hypothetical protein
MGRIAVFVFDSLRRYWAGDVPFLGCRSEGQADLIDARKRNDPVLPIPTAVAQRLAYYSSGGTGVLAPRGWYCFGGWGSDGEVLRIAPRPFDASGQGWNGFAGPCAVRFNSAVPCSMVAPLGNSTSIAGRNAPS